jgi:ABC-type amino acid transport substrate-binding protein
MRVIFSRIVEWARFHLVHGRDTIGEFLSDAFPFLLLFAVVGVAGSLTGLTTFTFLDKDPTAEIVSSVSGEVDKISDRHTIAISTLIGDSTNSLKQDIAELKTAITADTGGGRRHRSTATSSLDCVKLPSGFDVDIATLTAASKGANVLGTGETYAAALVRHGFLVSEVEQLDEPTCQKIYDGWRTLYPPEVRPVLSTSSSGRWTCTGGRCYRN